MNSAQRTLNRLAEEEIDLDVVTDRLEKERVEQFRKPYEATIEYLSQVE